MTSVTHAYCRRTNETKRALSVSASLMSATVARYDERLSVQCSVRYDYVECVHKCHQSCRCEMVLVTLEKHCNNKCFNAIFD